MARRGLALVPADLTAQTAPASPSEAGDGGAVSPPAGAPSGAPAGGETAARQEALEAVLSRVRRRWGQGSIVRLDEKTGTRETDAQETAALDGLLVVKQVVGQVDGRVVGETDAGGSEEGAPGGRARRETRARARRPRELPRWWPVAGLGGGEGPEIAGTRPRMLELVGETGSGQLTLALAWIAAAQPALAAVVDPGRRALEVPAAAPRGGPTPRDSLAPRAALPALPAGQATGPGGVPLSAGQSTAPDAAPDAGHDGARDRPAGWFYAPAAASAGIDLQRLVVVRPPEDGAARGALDAVVLLLRSEAFDVVLCPLPVGARINTTFAGMLATLAARSGTTLFLLTRPRARGLGAFAEYRIRLGRRRWVWQDGEIAGIRLRAATERARAAAGMTLSGADEAPPEHELTLRLHRRVRHGPPGRAALPRDARDARERPAPGAADRLYLAGSSRLLRQPDATGRPDAPGLAAPRQRGLRQNAG